MATKRKKKKKERESARGPSVEELRARLLERSFPRLQMVAILTFTGMLSFLTSISLLEWGLESIALRYGVATVFGYVYFLLLVRCWLAYQVRGLSFGWGGGDESATSTDLSSLDIPNLGGASDAIFSGGGGSFGGGGASGDFSGVGSGGSLSLDIGSGGSGGSASGVGDLFEGAASADEGLPIILAIVALLAGACALGFVVYSSPILFAEVLVDAAVLGAVYRRAQKHERGFWLHGVVRRTWIPALVLVVFSWLFGFAIQMLAPDRTTLGEALEEWGSKEQR